MSIVQGMVRLARFRIDGFQGFGNSAQAVLNSLAPLLAFPLVGGVFGVLGGQALPATVDFLATVVALLAPLVITHWLAARWQRLAEWPRFAAASNWCQWTLPLLAIGLVIVVMVLQLFGLPLQALVMVGLIGLVGYGLALHYFLARHGLRLSVGRAVLLVLVTDVSTGAMVVIPRLLTGGSL